MTPTKKGLTDLEAIFHEALQRETSPERSAYLDGACGDDADLRSRAEALLDAHVEASSFLEKPAFEGEEAQISEGPGTHIGPYKLLQEIGVGGMGVVYMAEQAKPVRRKVALKVIKLGMDTKQVIARFEAERQALALMDHPGIAKVLDAGSTEAGRPYFVMELVRGISINEYCDKNNLSTQERLELFIAVCRGVQHAHQKGVIHRDIKPSNILVTSHDGRPVPKIIDFGVAKATHQRLTEQTLFTEFQQFIGTPEFMSPEQAEMSGLDVDTRTDVYSLGVLLYELLTGTTPVDAETLRAAGYGEIQRIIREEEAPAPSTRVSKLGDAVTQVARQRDTEPGALAKIFRGDLDWIVMKALEKDRTRRYDTVSEMGDDVQRHLDSRPVLAGPPSTLYRVHKFIRRNKVSVLAGTLAGGAIILGLAAATVGLLRANAEIERNDKIRDNLNEMLASVDPLQAAAFSVDVESVLATSREVFGEEHAAVAATLNSLAVQLQNSGNFEAADPLYRESLALWKEIYGDEHMNVGITLSRLGALLRMQGDDAGAEEALREGLRIMDAASGPSLPSCDTRAELADLLSNRGEYDAAKALLTESLELREASPSDQHFKVLEDLERLLKVLLSQGDNAGIESVLTRIYTLVNEFYPPESPFVATAAMGYGNWLVQNGRAEEAIPYLREARELLRDQPGSDFLRVATLDRLFQALRSRTDDEGIAEANEILEEVIGVARKFWGPQMLLQNVAYLSQRLQESGRYADALPHALEALQIATVHDPNDAELAHRLGGHVGSLAYRIGADPDSTPQNYETALAAVEEVLAGGVTDEAFTVTRGALQYRLGRLEQASATFEHLGPEPLGLNVSPWVAEVLPADLAFRCMVQHALGNSEEARSLLAELRNAMELEDYADDEDRQKLFAEVEALLGS